MITKLKAVGLLVATLGLGATLLVAQRRHDLPEYSPPSDAAIIAAAHTWDKQNANEKKKAVAEAAKKTADDAKIVLEYTKTAKSYYSHADPLQSAWDERLLDQNVLRQNNLTDDERASLEKNVIYLNTVIQLLTPGKACSE